MQTGVIITSSIHYPSAVSRTSMKRILPLFLFALFFIACGGDSSASASDSGEGDISLKFSSSVKTAYSSSSAKSSSFAKSSSSVKVVDPVDVIVGSMIDSRDGQTYKTVTIGSQTWMAQNLNYETADSYCYNDDEANCSQYGRLYTWDAAKEACPSDWHLPSLTEWNTLRTTVGGNVLTERKVSEGVRSTFGWIKGQNGTDAFSFSALPAGSRVPDGTYGGEGSHACFWSSTEHLGIGAYAMSLTIFSMQSDSMSHSRKVYGRSIRCLKSDTPMQTVESSSSESAKSSSSAESSSSKVVVHGSKGTLLDSRDGQTYKTVAIGSQMWMAQNLNYAAANSYCYNDNVANCTKNGRLYIWTAAMEACPSGWHLPSKAEFETMFATVDDSLHLGEKLKSTSGWALQGHGNDKLGFTALPAGGRLNKRSYENQGYGAYFWSSTPFDSDVAYLMYLNYNRSGAFILSYDNYFAFSVRCVQD